MTTQSPRKGFSVELLIALSALVVSMCALVVSLYEARILNAQQKAATWPYVDAGISYNSEGYKIEVRNNGIGPARMTGVRLVINETVYRTWPDAIASILGPDNPVTYNVYGTQTLNGMVLPPTSETAFISLPWRTETRTLLDSVQQAELTICYCSVFDECWVTTFEKAGVEASCPISTDQQFKG